MSSGVETGSRNGAFMRMGGRVAGGILSPSLLRSGAATDGGLRHARREILRLAIWIGFASTVAVAAATLLPHTTNRYTHEGVVYGLTVVAAGANAIFGLLALRLAERRGEETLLLLWGLALVGLVATLTYAGGGYSSDYYLLYFLAISFVAATQRPRAQALQFGLLVAGYAWAVLAVPLHPHSGDLLLRLGVLAGAEVLGWYLAAALRAEAMRRARSQAEADLKNLLAVEANHRIKNNLQLIGDLLSFEASKPAATLPDVVDVTLGRVQAVAAVHALLAASGDGQIQTATVLERVLHLLTERLAAETPVEARVEGTCPDLDPQRATWLAVAVNELATNALLHGLRNRGGHLTLHLEAGETADGGGPCRVVVDDDGEGLGGAPEGLGLSLVRRLVEDGLRGQLQLAASTPDGQGTRAEITFPAAAPLQPAAATGAGR